MVAAFRHFDNRDGFPLLHDHCLILNRVQRRGDNGRPVRGAPGNDAGPAPGDGDGRGRTPSSSTGPPALPRAPPHRRWRTARTTMRATVPGVDAARAGVGSTGPPPT
ncbi:relaxase domain-containing protein [Streptomyces sp. NPDC087218]|uniref:relaxase domain-containing protein n=1 Tax=Streptomyces sp. NPDC087218 TaxID=3365769 RepID=UPI0038271A96